MEKKRFSKDLVPRLIISIIIMCLVLGTIMTYVIKVRRAIDAVEDVDHCVDRNGGCEQICTSYEGFSNCSCLPGYKLGSDRKSCYTIKTA
ncbi:bone morphogenetic protein 1-like [Ptychodera flava]|uniref:bone morphogenetic protein 1-like n=1 Tax=Ptychodera flava TaxID=63121 RepID=UPI003969F7FC